MILLLPACLNSPQEQLNFNYNKKNTLENLILKIFYRNYSNNGSYSTFSDIHKPEVKLEKNRVIIKTHVFENFTVWGKVIEVTVNNISLEIINVTLGIYKIEDFETMNVSKGELIMAEAKMSKSYTEYENLNIELKVAVWYESCCGNYREYILGSDFKREDLK